MKSKYTVVLSRQAEHFFRKLEGKVKAKVRECLISLEEEAYAGKRLRGDLKENWSLRVVTLLNFNKYFPIFNLAPVALKLYLGDFRVLPIAHVKFPAVAWTHNNVACQDSSFEGAAHVRATV